MSDQSKSTIDGAVDPETGEPSAAEIPAGAQDASDRQNWQMPAPVFRKTSGYLPQGYVKDFEKSDAAESPPSASLMATVEEQPDIAEVILPENFETVKSFEDERVARKSVPPLMVILGFIGILVFAIVFVLVVYFLFLRNSAAI